jgi:hypothetical protein
MGPITSEPQKRHISTNCLQDKTTKKDKIINSMGL